MELVVGQVGRLPGMEVSEASSLLADDFAREVVGQGWHIVHLKDLPSALSI